VCVIKPRDGYMLYLPLMGWALFIGPLLSHMIEGVVRFSRSAGRAALRLTAVAGVVAALSFVHYRQLAQFIPGIHEEQRNTRRVIEQIKQQQPQVEKAAFMLFINDPLAPGFGLPFLVKLSYGDPTLVLDRSKEMPHPVTAIEMTLYDAVFEYQRGYLRLMAREERPVQISFVPDRVHSGERYTVVIPQYASQSIDVAVRVSNKNSAYRAVVPNWCNLDGSGHASFVTPAGLENSRISIRKVRTGGGEWRRATGQIDIVQ
jgi:hypothetical protein